MTTTLFKAYAHGTHRWVAPEDTFARIEPHLARAGITRCADITGLDKIGVPVYTAVRPTGRFLQVSAGKGLRPIDAMVSALMEAIEFHHWDTPTGEMRRSTRADLVREGARVVSPDGFPRLAETHLSEERVLTWMPARDLCDDSEVWVPASAVYPVRPALFDRHTNGLASGNHLVEATLHALYELIERDAITRLFREGKLMAAQGRCRVVDLDTVGDSVVGGLIEQIRRAGVRLLLVWTESRVPMHSFWAVVIDDEPLSHTSSVNFGYGAHLSPSVAAVRAITEVLQSRLSFIHGAREDMTGRIREADGRPTDRRSPGYRFLDSLVPEAPWSSFTDYSGDTLDGDYAQLLGALFDRGCRDLVRVDLTRAPFDVPVVQVFAPSLEFSKEMF